MNVKLAYFFLSIAFLILKKYIGSQTNYSSDIEGGLKVGLEVGIAKINAEVDLGFENSDEELLKNIDIKIHGSLKKPIIAVNFKDLIKELKHLKANPEEYLTPNPLYFGCIPLSAFLKREEMNFMDDLREDELKQIYNLKVDFQNQFQIINSLVVFARDVSEQKKHRSEDLRSVIDNLGLIKKHFQEKFKIMQDQWITKTGRKIIQPLEKN